MYAINASKYAPPYALQNNNNDDDKFNEDNDNNDDTVMLHSNSNIVSGVASHTAGD